MRRIAVRDVGWSMSRNCLGGPGLGRAIAGVAKSGVRPPERGLSRSGDLLLRATRHAIILARLAGGSFLSEC